MADIHVAGQVQGMAKHLFPLFSRCFGKSCQPPIFRQGVKPAGRNPEPAAGKGEGSQECTFSGPGSLKMFSVFVGQGKRSF